MSKPKFSFLKQIKELVTFFLRYTEKGRIRETFVDGQLNIQKKTGTER